MPRSACSFPVLVAAVAVLLLPAARVGASASRTAIVAATLIAQGPDSVGAASEPGRLGAVVDSLRASGDPVLLVDGGDAFEFRTRGPGDRNASVRRRLAEAGYDVVGLGERDLLGGPDSVAALLLHASPSPPVVCANVRERGGRPVAPAYKIVERGGLRFGVTGVVSPDLYTLYRGPDPDPPPFRFEPPDSALLRVLKELRGRVDVTVALFHAPESEVARTLSRVTGLDVLVVGHDPGLASSHLEDGTVVMRPGITGAFLAAVRLEVDPGGGVSTLAASLLPLGRDPEHDWDQERTVHELLTDWERSMAMSRPPAWRPVYGLSRPEAEVLLAPRGLEPPAIRPGGALEGAFLGPGGRRVAFRWTGGPVPDSRSGLWNPWTPPHRVSLDEGGDREPLSVGGEAETIFLQAIDRVVSDSLTTRRADTLRTRVKALAVPFPGRDPAPGDLAPGERTLWPLLVLERYLKGQAEAGLTETPRYWHRRRLVYVDATFAPDGTCRAAKAAQSYASPEDTDRALATVRGWRIPPPDAKRATTVDIHRVAAVATDRRERGIDAPAGRGLPDSVRAALGTGRPGRWTAALRAADSAFSLDDFLAAPPAGPEGVRRLERHDGEPDPGATFPGARIVAAGRVSPRVRVFAGWAPVDHPRLPGGELAALQVPVVWIADLEAGLVTPYWGAPVPLPSMAAARAALAGSGDRE